MTTLHPSNQHPCLGRSARRRIGRIALSAILLATLVACRATSPRTAAPDRIAPPPANQEPADPTYDWHGLLIAPFGSVLKDIPVALHEVLLFRDDAHGSAATGNIAATNVAAGNAAADAAAVDAECYAADAPAPRFVGRIPEEYLLCFNQGRLSRIQASVRMTAAQAPEVFAAACAGWLKNAASTTGAEAPGAGTPGAAVSPSAETPSAGACEGRDSAIHFRGRLEEEPGRAETPQSESVLSITLDSAPYP
jgi:hypothetical protein